MTLGDYNPRRKAFPLDYPGRKGVEIPDTLRVRNEADLRNVCPVAANTLSSSRAALPGAYAVSIKPAYYSELPMDEGTARKYIDAAGPQRDVFLVLDATILDTRPEISSNNFGISLVTFRAQTARIRVIDQRTGKPLGALFDDGSLRAEVQGEVQSAPPSSAPPAPQKPANQWAFGDHMYEIRTAVYVSLAADACGWPLTSEQSANLSRFLDQTSTRGNFNERYQYNLAHGKIKDAISAEGRQNFCANPVERQSFGKLSASIAPLGPSLPRLRSDVGVAAKGASRVRWTIVVVVRRGPGGEDNRPSRCS